MFLIDDITIGPMVSLFKYLRDFALMEMYDPGKLNDRMKENRLLYELGEITREEYEQTNAQLVEKLEIATKVRSEMDPNVQVRRME